MVKTVFKAIERIPWVVLMIVPVGLFFLLLTGAVLPLAFLQFFQAYSLWLVLLLLVIYYACFRLPGKAGWLAGFAFTLLIFALPLLYKWQAGFSDNWVIGGLIPYKDGQHYLQAVDMILEGERIPVLTYQPAERPLNPGFMTPIFGLVNSNLKWALATLVLLAAVAAYLAARAIFTRWGPLAAAVFGTLLFLYLQELIGRLNSELPGFILGCLGLVLLWRAAEDLKPGYLYLGVVVLMLAVSARAGAFFVFPLLALWAGWAFRAEQRFSLKIAAITALVVGLAFLLFNMIYPRLVVEPGRAAFSNFAFMIYGQVRGGTGWTEGFDVTGTKNPEVILNAALDFFQRHPLSLAIGFAKSYRDFFIPNSHGIFPLASAGLIHVLLWLLALALLVWGTVKSLRRRSALDLLLLACFAGIFFSIPFLPPVDGGNRFYASTMALFFAMVVLPLEVSPRQSGRWGLKAEFSIWPAALLGGVMVILTVLSPILLQQARGLTPVLESLPEITCPADQQAFVIRQNPAYVDLVPEREAACGMSPEVCLGDFLANGMDATTDDFFQELARQAQANGTATRVVPYANLLDIKFHFFVGPRRLFAEHPAGQLLLGCATEIRTQHQSIFQVESVTDFSTE